ncbi:MAG: carbohydrate kinase family protein [Bryobacteraceae bacterium]|nr:carbohydrate kinase family protein [Bryobacteraceae bacterium]
MNLTGVLCCGNIVFDIAVWPVENLDWSTTTWVEAISEGLGGNGANSSYSLARLGVPVTLISVVGSDARGDWLLRKLASAEVDTSMVSRTSEYPTPSTVVLIQRGGARKFLHRPGASRQMRGDSVMIHATPGISHFHLANPFAFPILRTETAAIMKRAKDAGLTTSIDTGWDSKGRWIDDLGEALGSTDILFVNDSEARMLGGSQDLQSAAEALHRLGVPHVVVKTGVEGCSLYAGGKVENIRAFKVEAVDTTGAGDCFVGGFLAGLYRGWTFPECARLGNALGAMNVQQIGASEGVRSFDETVEWMRVNWQIHDSPGTL